jgi:hypothetical protein
MLPVHSFSTISLHSHHFSFLCCSLLVANSRLTIYSLIPFELAFPLRYSLARCLAEVGCSALPAHSSLQLFAGMPKMPSRGPSPPRIGASQEGGLFSFYRPLFSATVILLRQNSFQTDALLNLIKYETIEQRPKSTQRE